MRHMLRKPQNEDFGALERLAANRGSLPIYIYYSIYPYFYNPYTHFSLAVYTYEYVIHIYMCIYRYVYIHRGFTSSPAFSIFYVDIRFACILSDMAMATKTKLWKFMGSLPCMYQTLVQEALWWRHNPPQQPLRTPLLREIGVGWCQLMWSHAQNYHYQNYRGASLAPIEKYFTNMTNMLSILWVCASLCKPQSRRLWSELAGRQAGFKVGLVPKCPKIWAAGW